MKKGTLKFIDTARIRVIGGKGGNGSLSFQHIIASKKRPDGGHGGRGGDVIIRASSNVQTLNLPSSKFQAQSGGRGGKQNSSGKLGSNLEVLVPPGTIVTKLKRVTLTAEQLAEQMAEEEMELIEEDKEEEMGQGMGQGMGQEWTEMDFDEFGDSFGLGDDEEEDEMEEWITAGRTFTEEEVLCDLDEDGKSVVVARGGRGGRGNIDFASLSYRFIDRETFRKRMIGKPGEEFELKLTLKSIAEVGLVGFPNAGKSTLLGALSRAKPEVANYPFTTINPTLGMVDFTDGERLTVADIPGIVEGAHENRGLGHKFLRHIERTNILVFVLDCSLHGLFPDKPEYLVKQAAEERVIPEEEILHRIVSNYSKLVDELELYLDGLSTRPSMLLLNKMDRVGAVEVNKDALLQKIVDFNRELHETSGNQAFETMEEEEEEKEKDDEPSLHSNTSRFPLPLPIDTFSVSAKFGGGLRPFVHRLREVVFEQRQLKKAREEQERLEQQMLLQLQLEQHENATKRRKQRKRKRKLAKKQPAEESTTTV